MTNYASGHRAEQVAAQYLQSHRYRIIQMNWKHVRAEIDIIARKKIGWHHYGPLTFFEVKYRKTDHQGRGLDYITFAKLRQMQFAAEIYVSTSNYSGDYTLGAIELSGEDYQVTNFIDNLS